ncbi:MAG: carboxylesterase family protein [Clostridia bacterium]|nr:carboxylesterase family protein [Clostridia bacterium]
MKKIDVHLHASSAAQARESLAYLRGKGVAHAILMSVDETERNREICAQVPGLHWMCGISAGDPNTVFDRLAEYKEAGALGVGELCVNERMDSPLLQALFAAAESMEMPVLFHMSPEVGFQYGIVDEPGLPLLEETLKKHPHLKIIGHSQPFWIEISGDAPTDREGRNSRGEGPVAPGGRVVELLRKYPNLYADLSAGSGFCAIVRDEAFGLRFLEEFQDQLLFGTDTVDVHSPWQPPLADWLEEKYGLGLISEAVLRKICYGNAEKLFGKLLHDDENTVVTDTPCGPVKGFVDEKRCAYLGIPYASAERFAYPTVTTHWEGTLDATDFGPCSWQFRSFRSEALGEDPFYYNEFRKDIPFRYGDDCQRLNIWTPLEKPDKPLPVIVYIHGGAFLGGSSGEKHLAPPCWTEAGVIAVSLNYRLGPFGFLCASEGVRESGHTGNYGIYDQLAALKWVRDNIAAFGGDPDNVTLMGQSAGCMSVQMLCISPKAKGLFRRAVLCSGAGRSEFFDGKNTMEENLSFGDAVMEALGCKTMEDMRHVSAWRIQKTFGEQLMKANRGLAVTSPVIDGDLIPCPVSTAIKEKLLHNIPYILCSTGQDLWQPELYHAILKWEDEAEAQGIGPCYAAHFSRHLPGDDRGAFHSADLWYWCGTLQNSWRPNTDWDRELSRRMAGYLTSFAKTGNPNGGDLPLWQTHGEAPDKIMVFSDETASQQNAGEIMKKEEKPC